MNKIFKTLLFALSVSAITAQAGRIWLQNEYGKAIIVKFNRKEVVVANRNRVSLGDFGDLESLAIRTNTMGSFYSNILEIKGEIWQNPLSRSHDAVIVVGPSTLFWDLKIEWEKPNKSIIAK
jgi:hypothetical protein